MFLDEKELVVTAGKGGDGAALFRREKYVPRGGPDGGDGGRGGDVHIIGKANLHALSHLAHVEKIRAEDGHQGGHRRSTGKSGAGEEIAVPLGTIIYEKKEEDWQLVGEITEEGDSLLIAKGGNGGWGNWHFRSSIQQAPERFNAGLPGEQKQIKLVLKLIADVGLVGLPNAGKSTLLSVVSAARPKIADYPFTTLEPQLGVVELPDHKLPGQIVIADLPGLIEGASQGKGLGATFLKHIERTSHLLHCIDSSLPLPEIEQNYQAIREELASWSPELAKKDETVVLTKAELVEGDELEEKVAALEKISGKKVFTISAATHTGLLPLLTSLLR